MEDTMKYLFFFLVLTSFACAASKSAQNASSQLDDANQATALSKLGVTSVGVRADGDRLLAVACAISEGDATTVAKTMRRMARDDIAKTYCPNARVEIKDLGRPDSALVGRIYCVKFAVMAIDISCER
jgi:hypothetical protein